MRLQILFILLIILNIESVYAQSLDENRVLTKIETLFNGMRSGDSAAVASVFLKNATMQSISKDRDGNTRINTGSLSAFKNSVATPHDQIWDERVANIKINIDGDMAVAWVPYSFYSGEDFSHCGVNSFQFIKTDKGWKALSIVDTRRNNNCIEDL